MDKRLISLFTESARIKYFWIFLTAKCNLRCNYCFFKCYTNKTSVTASSIKLLIQAFPRLMDAEFVISGGEPLMDWKNTSKLITFLRSFKDKYILLQTNGTLLNKAKIAFLKDHRVGLELGIDGDLSSMKKHRIGINNYFPNLLKNIQLARLKNIDLFTTMTVLPKTANQMYKNYIFLKDIGIKKIEVTPAAFSKWTISATEAFKNNYIKIIKFASKSRCLNSLSTGYDTPLPYPMVDFIYLPDHTVLTNWALLSSPLRSIAKYTMFRTNKQRITLNKRFDPSLLYDYISFFQNNKTPTYRDFSNLNARRIFIELYKKSSWQYWQNYEQLGDFLKKTNQNVIILKRNRYDQNGR